MAAAKFDQTQNGEETAAVRWSLGHGLPRTLFRATDNGKTREDRGTKGGRTNTSRAVKTQAKDHTRRSKVAQIHKEQH